MKFFHFICRPFAFLFCILSVLILLKFRKSFLWLSKITRIWWPIWWKHVCYEHHPTEFHCENCNPNEILGFQIYLSILANMWYQIWVLLFNGSSHFCLESSIYMIHNLGLSIITLTNCCTTFFRMVLVTPFQNRIKMGDHWTFFKTFLTTFLIQFLMDSIHSLSGSSHHFTHSTNFVALTTHFYFVLMEKTFQFIFMWFWKNKYICM